METIVFS
jgi:hypothetical protein